MNTPERTLCVEQEVAPLRFESRPDAQRAGCLRGRCREDLLATAEGVIQGV